VRIILRTITCGLFLVLVMVNVPNAMAFEHNGPVRVWGELSSTYRVRESGTDHSKNTNLLNSGTISASSYVWRPWFALVNGSLSLSVEDTDIEDQPSSTNEFATGDIHFSLFPSSRFPFSAYYIESRNQFDNDTFGSDVTNTEYGVSQLYRSVDGRHDYRAEYETDKQENNRQEDNAQSEFISESLLLSVGNRLGRHSIDTDVKLDTVDNTTTDEQVSTKSITLDHNYGDASNFSLDNLLSNSTVELDLVDSNDELDTSQLSSFLFWRPRNKRDLRLTGSLRLSETDNRKQPANVTLLEPVEIETSTANLNQGLIYEYTDNLQFSESINVNSVESEGETQTIISEALSVRYSADRATTALGDYGWFAGTSYRNLHGDAESEKSLDSQLSQSLHNDYSDEGNYQLRTNLTQSLNYDYESEREDEKSIDHSYSVTWSSSAIKNQNLIRFFISDSRNLNREGDVFQLVNFQYTGSMRYSRYSQLNGNLTLQQTNQESGRQKSEQTTSNGRLVYLHNRAFQVSGLSFLSELRLSQSQSDADRLFDGHNSDTEVSLENSLLYRIGRLEVELNIDFIKVGDEYDRLFKFELTRSFGDL